MTQIAKNQVNLALEDVMGLYSGDHMGSWRKLVLLWEEGGLNSDLNSATLPTGYASVSPSEWPPPPSEAHIRSPDLPPATVVAEPGTAPFIISEQMGRL